LFPRAQLDHVTFALARVNQMGVGFSAGATADVTSRLGVHVSADWLHLTRRVASSLTLEGGWRGTAGIGGYVRL
jgi:hypothetical protein